MTDPQSGIYHRQVSILFAFVNLEYSDGSWQFYIDFTS